MIVRGPRTFALDRAIIKATGYSLGCFQIALHRGERYYPSIVLTTIGRKSGQLREAALPYVERDGELVVVASLGGGPAEPHWAQNLRADSRCWVTLNRRRRTATARELDDEERRQALAQAAATRRSVTEYDERAAGNGRVMALFALRVR